MARKIIGVTVGTPMKPQAVIEKTEQAKQIEQHEAHTKNGDVHITNEERKTWNNKSNFSGSYDDLKNKPTIPTKTSQLTNDSNFVKKEVTDQLYDEIVDLNGVVVGKANKGYVDEEIVKAKTQMAKGNPIFVNSVEDCTDIEELYLLPDGYIYAHQTKEVTNEETIIVKGKVARLENMRYSNSSASFKSASGYHTLVIPIESTGTNDVITLAFTNATWTSYYDNLLYGETNTKFSGTATRKSGNTGDSTLTITNISSGKWFIEALVISDNFANIGVAVDGVSLEVITSTTGTEATLPSTTTTSETVTQEGFFTTGVKYTSNNNPTEIIVKNDISSCIGTIQAPIPQLSANGSETSDLNLNTCLSDDLHAYLNDVVARYPNYIVRELMGKDESNTYNIYRYTLSKHSYTAWQKANYPKMYGWVNGSTIIYSLSVSPRIGDTMYSTKYIGTSYGTVSAVSSANRTRTVNGTVFTRSESNDVEPTLAYSQNIVVGTSLRNSSLATIDSISTINGNTVTSANGVTYYRYPFGDLDKNTKKRIPMTIIANEHGGSGEPRDCALIVARFIRDLCENKHQDNPIFKYIRENVNLTVIPCVNPYGWNMYNSANGYRNANGVNINRNYDTQGWDVYLAENSDEASTMGAYAGSENETQYVMNTMTEIGSKIAMSVHGIDVARENLVVYYQGQNPNGAYSEDKIAEIYEDYLSRYGLRFVAYNPLECPPSTTSKSPSYITQMGAYGGIIEFNNNDAQIKEGEANRRYTSWTMEQQYTLLLKFLAMWISDYEESL